MKVSEIFKHSDKGVAFEFFPPKSEKAKAAFIGTVKALKEYDPLYVSMTCGAGGTAQEFTQAAVVSLLDEGGLEVMPHLTCLDLLPQDADGILSSYASRGIDNIMVLRGDPPEAAANFNFLDQNFSYAVDLVRFVKKHGNFCVGVAVYPEGHIESSSFDNDLEYAKQKIDAGADFAVTQMFFDNTYYYRLLDKMQARGINIPVLPGILPLTDIAKVKQFVSICRATIPDDIDRVMTGLTGDPQGQEEAGIEFTIRQCRDLIRNGAKKLHFFTLNKPRVMKKILEAIL